MGEGWGRGGEGRGVRGWGDGGTGAGRGAQVMVVVLGTMCEVDCGQNRPKDNKQRDGGDDEWNSARGQILQKENRKGVKNIS